MFFPLLQSGHEAPDLALAPPRHPSSEGVLLILHDLRAFGRGAGAPRKPKFTACCGAWCPGAWPAPRAPLEVAARAW